MIPSQDYDDGTESVCRFCLQPILFEVDRWLADYGSVTASGYCEWAELASDWHWHQPLPKPSLTVTDIIDAARCNDAVNSDRDWNTLDVILWKLSRSIPAAHRELMKHYYNVN